MHEHDELEQSQDLAAHFYTGRGLRAKHQSEILHEKNSYSENAEEKNFQIALVEKLEKQYQDELNKLNAKRSENLEKLNAVKEDAHYQENDAILYSFREAMRQEKAYRKEAADALETHGFLQKDLEDLQDRLAEQDKDLTPHQEALEKVRNNLSECINKIEEYSHAINDTQANDGILSTSRLWFYEKRMDHYLSLHNQLVEEFVQKSAVVKDYTEKKKITEKQVELTRRRMDVLLETYHEACGLEKEFGNVADYLSHNFAERFTENYTIPSEQENETDNKADSQLAYLEALAAQDENKQLDQEITTKEEGKASIKKRVQNAEVLDMVPKGYLQKGYFQQGYQTVRAASIDGKMYYDNTQLTENMQADTPLIVESTEADGKIVKSEEKVFLEEEKIISQLKHLPIFQYMNSDTLMEYMEYDEKQGNFMFQQQPGANGQATPTQATTDDLTRLGFTDDVAFEDENQGSFMRMLSGIWGGTVNIGKWGCDLGKNIVSGMLGITDLEESWKKREVGDTSGSNVHMGLSIANEGKSLAKGANFLLFEQMKANGLADTINRIETKKLLGMDMLGSTNVSIATGVGSALSLVMGITTAYDGYSTANEQEDYSKRLNAKGLNRYSALMGRAASENEARGFGGAVDAVMAPIEAALSMLGIGGLVITAATIAINQLIKNIGAWFIRRGTTKEILNSPHVLGSLKYDKEIIDDDHFDRLFAQVTGLNSKDDLATALKVVDGIDLHRSMRQSLLVPNPDTYLAMAKLGYPDPLAYHKITLSDLLAKTGVKDDWRQTLRNTIEIKGLDYNTNWTRFVKGITANRNHYADEKRLTRNEMAAQRRRSLLEKKWHIDSANISLGRDLFALDEEKGELTFR